MMNSENAALSSLKPVVSMLAMLLATTSSSRLSAICRDKPMRSAFSIGTLSPFSRARRRRPASPLVHAAASPKLPAEVEVQKLCQWVKLCRNGHLGEKMMAVKRAETATARRQPGKFFRPGRTTQASVNHSGPSFPGTAPPRAPGGARGVGGALFPAGCVRISRERSGDGNDKRIASRS
jgi:hypothetical protein